MNLVIAATVFAAIFPSELPDKTFVATLVLATRFSAFPVWLGAAAAFLVQTVVAGAAGGGGAGGFPRRGGGPPARVFSAGGGGGGGGGGGAPRAQWRCCWRRTAPRKKRPRSRKRLPTFLPRRARDAQQ